MSLDTPFRRIRTNCEQHASVTLVTRQPRTHTCVDINTPRPCKTPSQWIARARLHPLRSTFANKRAPLVHIPTSQAARAGSGLSAQSSRRPHLLCLSCYTRQSNCGHLNSVVQLLPPERGQCAVAPAGSCHICHLRAHPTPPHMCLDATAHPATEAPSAAARSHRRARPPLRRRPGAVPR